MTDNEEHVDLKGKKILIVLNAYFLGGAERQALVLADGMRDRYEADVEIAMFNECEPIRGHCEAQAIPYRRITDFHRILRSRYLFGYNPVARQLKEASPLVLISYTYFPNIVCGRIWSRTGASLFVWNQNDEGIGIYPEWAMRKAARRVPLFVSCSLGCSRYLTNQLKVDPANVHEIYNGIAPPSPINDKPFWIETLGIAERDFCGCFVANVTKYKDHATLIRAWHIVAAELKKQGRNARLILIGKQEEQTMGPLVKLVSDLSLESHITFAGFVEDVAGLLQAVDLGVFSSISEGLPNGVLECMAAGLPVVGTDIPGVKSAVGPKGSQFLSPIRDHDKMAERILYLANHPEVAQEMATHNKQRIASEFSLEKMVDETCRVISKFL